MYTEKGPCEDIPKSVYPKPEKEASSAADSAGTLILDF
jgi:hypothetical protein